MKRVSDVKANIGPSDHRLVVTCPRDCARLSFTNKAAVGFLGVPAGQAADETVLEGGVPHAFSSVKISVKNAGSEFIRSMLRDRVLTMSKHRSQNRSLESSTRKGFSG
uniref:Uncharacterized protein n=1 Tax=Homalodisca liturata TaxID=320908 RepID=A0A1B6JN26_9HEMI